MRYSVIRDVSIDYSKILYQGSGGLILAYSVAMGHG